MGFMLKQRFGYFSFLLLATVTISLFPVYGHAQDQAPNSLPLEELQVFSEVFGKIKSEYVDRVDDTSLLRDAIQGMLAGLDPHSTFLEPEDFEEIKISTDGKFGGLGIEVTSEDGLIKVVTPIDGTPAFDAGIHPGDLIIMIDDIPVRGMSLKDAVDKMRGEPGSEIKLTVSRQGENNPLEFNLVRAIIKVQSVRGEILEDGFGYVRLSSFQSGTAHSLRSKIKQLNEANGGMMNGLVLDLRNNPGGVLTGAVEVSDLFLERGEIVSTRGRTPTSGQSFTARPDDIIDDAPMIVLVNGGSASASEIVAGALQDHRRAIIMGTKTFGKGSVQTVIPMNNGGALKLTTARYYTPSERSIQARGIEPDIVTQQMNLPTAGDPGKTVSESDLTGHLKNDDAEDEPGRESLTRMSERISRDHQLREALNLLKGMSLVKQRSVESKGQL
jgi:carboxyl-terminal processing protease